MKTLTKFYLLSLVFCFLTFAGFSQVKSDYDKSTDFSKYKTYSFEGWQDNSDQELNDFDKKRILDALKSEFDARGMTYKESMADASVILFIVLDNKTSTTAYTNFTGGYGYGARWGWGMGAGMGGATTTYSESDYTEGTLVVDLYDTEAKSLAWQGVLTSVVKDKPAKREKTIPKKISKLMKEYPVDPM